MDLIRLLAVARKEWWQLRRDLRSLTLAFAFPVLLVVFFGYAITWDVDQLSLGVWDEDRSQASRELVDALAGSGLFSVIAHPSSESETRSLLVRGEAQAVLLIPIGFQRDLSARRGAQVQLLLDGADANTSVIAQNYAEAIISGFAPRGTPPNIGSPPPVRVQVRVRYNPELRSRHMIVPGLVAVVMAIISAMLTSLTIAREWERGTMEQLVSTPVTRLEVVLGKLLPYVAVGAIGVISTVVAGILLFQVPFRGSALFLAFQSFLFLVGALGVGVFISAAVKSQVLSIQIALIATYLPALLLSGFLFDIAAMPGPVQGATYLVPARYFIEVTRGVLLKGVGIYSLWSQTLFMLAFAVVGLTLATRFFRKRIEG